MQNNIKKAFTAAVVATTIAWSVGLSAIPFAAKAAPASGTLVKASLPAVYYVGADNKRYVFPNEKTYKTWFADFSGVQTITDAELAALPIGGNVTYKPGVRMVKITTDPKVYAVDAGGTLRWVSSEAVATALYGASWNQMIDDVSDAFFTNYKIGADVVTSADFSPASASGAATSINADKGLSMSADGELSVMLSSSQPMGGSLPLGATGVNLVRFDVHNGGNAAVTVDTLTIKRVGLGDYNDYSAMYVYEGNTRISYGRTFSSSTNETTFAGLGIMLAAGQTKSLWISADVDATNAETSNENAVKLIGMTAGALQATGLPVMGPTYTIAGATVGTLTAEDGNTPSSIEAGEKNAKVNVFTLAAADEDIMVSSVALYYSGTTSRDNLSNFVLKRGSNVLATASAINGDEQVIFVLNTPYTIEKGDTKTFDVYADLSGAARDADDVEFYFEESTDITATGSTYGYGVQVDITDIDTAAEADTLTIDAGQINITWNGPSVMDIAQDAKDVELFNFTMNAQADLEVRRIRLSFADSYTHLSDVKLIDTATGIVIGSLASDPDATEEIISDIFDLSAGQARTFKVTADIADTATGTVTVGLADFQDGDIRNLDSSQDVDVSEEIVPSSGGISGSTHNFVSASLTVTKSSGPVEQTYIYGAQGIELLGVILTSGSASDMMVDSVTVTASSTANDGSAAIGIRSVMLTGSLWNGSTQVGSTKSPNTSGELVFDNLAMEIPAGQSVTLMFKGNLANAIDDSDDTFTLEADIAANDVEFSMADGTNDSTGPSAVIDGTDMTVEAAGTLSVARSASDSDTEAGLVLGGGTNVVLAKYDFTAQNEPMKVTKAKFDVATASAVQSVSLYKGTTLIAGPKGVDVDGEVAFTDMAFEVPKDSTASLTVKANLTAVSSSSGTATGGDVTVTLMQEEFEARGMSVGSSTVLDENDVETLATAAIDGYTKIIRKSMPTIETSVSSYSLSEGDSQTMLRIAISADANGKISFKELTLTLDLTDAGGSSTLALAVPTDGGTEDEVLKQIGGDIIDVDDASTAYSAGVLTIVLEEEEQIGAGETKTYDVLMDVSGVEENDKVSVRMLGDSTNDTSVTSFETVSGYFVWSDWSVVGHSETTADWANGYKLDGIPSTSYVLK